MRSWIWKVAATLTLTVLFSGALLVGVSGCSKSQDEPKVEPGKGIPVPGRKDRKMPELPP
jgi:hypothetical protein